MLYAHSTSQNIKKYYDESPKDFPDIPVDHF